MALGGFTAGAMVGGGLFALDGVLRLLGVLFRVGLRVVSFWAIGWF